MKIRTNLDAGARLTQEFRDAGIEFTDIFIAGRPDDINAPYDGDLIFRDAEGQEIVALQDDPRVAAVIAAHVPDPPIIQPDYGNDALPPDFRSQAGSIVDNLRQYINLPSAPTPAQRLNWEKMVSKLLLSMIRSLMMPTLLPPTIPEMPTPVIPLITPDLAPSQDEIESPDILTIETEREQAIALMMQVRSMVHERGLSDAALVEALLRVTENPPQPLNIASEPPSAPSQPPDRQPDV